MDQYSRNAQLAQRTLWKASEKVEHLILAENVVESDEKDQLQSWQGSSHSRSTSKKKTPAYCTASLQALRWKKSRGWLPAVRVRDAQRCELLTNGAVELAHASIFRKSKITIKKHENTINTDSAAGTENKTNKLTRLDYLWTFCTLLAIKKLRKDQTRVDACGQ